MAVWTAPRTWATGELVTASMMNQYVRDEFLWLSGGDGVSTAPPAAPTRYQRWTYVTGITHWTFIYRDDLDGTYPWHMFAGAPLIADQTAAASTSSSTPTNVGPSLTTPRAGYYGFEWQISRAIGAGGGANNAIIDYLLAGGIVATADGDYDSWGGGSAYTHYAVEGAGVSMSMQLSSSVNGQSSTLEQRDVKMLPIKVQ